MKAGIKLIMTDWINITVSKAGIKLIIKDWNNIAV